MGNISSCCFGREEEIDVNLLPIHKHAVFEHYNDDIQQHELETAFHQFLNGELVSTKFGFDPLVQPSQLKYYVDQADYQIVCSVHNKLYYIMSNKELVCSINVIEE